MKSFIIDGMVINIATAPLQKYEIKMDVLVKTLLDISDWHRLDKGHSVRVARMSLLIGRELNGGERLNEEKLKWLEIAGILHDFGRVEITDYILSKPGALTSGEYAEVKEHAKSGYKHLKKLFPAEVSLTVKYHHEKWDGSGYPEGLVGLDTPLFPRIVSITDNWDAILSKRPYHPARSREEAMIEMQKMQHWFDPRLFAIFLRLYAEGKL